MFPNSYFAPRYFAPRYFPRPSGVAPQPVAGNYIYRSKRFVHRVDEFMDMDALRRRREEEEIVIL